jgi:hypothetical protein
VISALSRTVWQEVYSNNWQNPLILHQLTFFRPASNLKTIFQRLNTARLEFERAIGRRRNKERLVISI